MRTKDKSFMGDDLMGLVRQHNWLSHNALGSADRSTGDDFAQQGIRA
jgi:hypothetical protein